jgi:hypothetical protein
MTRGRNGTAALVLPAGSSPATTLSVSVRIVATAGWAVPAYDFDVQVVVATTPDWQCLLGLGEARGYRAHEARRSVS